MDFSYNELIAIYGSVKQTRDTTNELLSKMDLLDPDREGSKKLIATCNSVLRKLNATFKENNLKKPNI